MSDLGGVSERRLTRVERARLVLLASVAATIILYIIPYGQILAYPLMLISTLAHEMGHGVMAMVVGGTFHKFEMWPDGSGVAVWSGEAGRLDRALVAAGGLVGPAILAALGFAFGRTAKGSRRALWGAVAILVLAAVLVVRNLFGFLFVVVLIAICASVARARSSDLPQLWLVFLSVQLALSVFSRGDYLFTPVARTGAGNMPSDVGQMAEALLLPYWFWGLACGGLSIIVLLYGVRVFWGRS